MRHFAANYIFNGTRLIKNAFVSVNNDNIITYVSEENEALSEKPKMIFFDGLLMPGLVNSHCHLELSDYIKTNEEHKGLTNFISNIVKNRNKDKDLAKIKLQDRVMFQKGISLVGDIVNTDKSLDVKKNSPIKYVNFIEINGLNNSEAETRFNSAQELLRIFEKNNLKSVIVPHAFYSVGDKLFELISHYSKNTIQTIHFLESSEEFDLFNGEKNNLFDFLQGFQASDLSFIKDINALYDRVFYLKDSASVIFVHNVHACLELFPKIHNPYFCICPKSNIYLHNQLPHANFVNQVKDRILLGTDSISSNDSLDLVEEAKIMTIKYPELDLVTILKAISSNGAEALGESNYGYLKIGKSPGLCLMKNMDFTNFKIKDTSFAQRII